MAKEIELFCLFVSALFRKARRSDMWVGSATKKCRSRSYLLF